MLKMLLLFVVGIQERRRRWGSSSVSRTPTSTHTAISSDVLEVIQFVIDY